MIKFLKFIKSLVTPDPNLKPNFCYGQDGEDLILNRLLDGQQKGFYVDVGAHHPVRFSNTYMFYQRGWSGINIDAMPGSMMKFKKIRPRDINIESGVAGSSGILKYYCFNEPALNTFDGAEAERKDKHPYHIVNTIDIGVERLDKILARYLPKGQTIDFMSIDVEGKDEEVLHSNDWTLYRPRIVLVETLRTDMLTLGECSVVKFLASVGYKPVSKAYNTSFFIREVN